LHWTTCSNLLGVARVVDGEELDRLWLGDREGKAVGRADVVGVDPSVVKYVVRVPDPMPSFAENESVTEPW
jgi:hypothetical protein